MGEGRNEGGMIFSPTLILKGSIVSKVILRNEMTKNPFPEWTVRILRYAQNDMKIALLIQVPQETRKGLHNIHRYAPRNDI